MLVGALEDRIRSRGRSRAELRYEERATGNRAFYERLGYTAYGTVPDGWDQQHPDGRIEWYETTCVQMRREVVEEPVGGGFRGAESDRDLAHGEVGSPE